MKKNKIHAKTGKFSHSSLMLTSVVLPNTCLLLLYSESV